MERQATVIVTPFGRFAAKCWGSDQGSPLIALHGWLDNAASFDPLAPYLDGFNLVALDLAGHGLSDHRPKGVPYHLVDYVRDVFAVAHALGWTQFGLLGHSLGAAIAVLLAGALPRCVTRLVLIEGLGPLVTEPEESPLHLARAVTAQSEEGKKRKPIYSSVEVVAKARQRAGDMSIGAARTLVARALEACEGGVTWRSDPRIRSSSAQPFTEAQVLAFVRRIEAPTLVVLNERGLVSRYPRMAERACCLADARIVRLPGGHHAHMDHPKNVADVINDFFASAANRTA